jgi:hypothetical protein
MSNEQDTVQVALESLLLLLYDMEFMSCPRDGHIMQSGCCGTRICIPNQLFQWKTLAADILPGHG